VEVETELMMAQSIGLFTKPCRTSHQKSISNIVRKAGRLIRLFVDTFAFPIFLHLPYRLGKFTIAAQNVHTGV